MEEKTLVMKTKDTVHKRQHQKLQKKIPSSKNLNLVEKNQSVEQEKWTKY